MAALDAKPPGRSTDRTELVPQLQRPPTPSRELVRDEPRTAMIRSPDIVLDATEVEGLQMSALLGGALSAHKSLPPPPSRRRRGVRWALWLGRLLVVSVLATFVLAIAALAATGVEERARTESKAEARFLQELLLTGSLPEAELHLGKLEALVAEAKNPKAQAALRARAEATLYRLHDANPSRKLRAQKLLVMEKGRKSSDGWMAEVLLAPAAERARRLREGAALALPGDAYPEALRAALEAAQGEIDTARASYGKAENLEPSHVIHLYGLFMIERGAGRAREAQLLLEQMEDVSPSSPWTRLAVARTKPDPAERATALLALVENTTLPAVPRALAAESALLDGSLVLEAETRAHLSEMQTTLLHGDVTFLAELPLPPRTHEGPTEPPPSKEVEATIVTPELKIELPNETKVKKKKARRKRRAR